MIDCGEPNFDAGYRLTEASGQRIADLEKDNERLREALQLIVANPTFRAGAIARAALEAKP